MRTTGRRPPSSSPIPDVLHKERNTLFAAAICSGRSVHVCLFYSSDFTWASPSVSQVAKTKSSTYTRM
ncbi:unnamed protein product [Closterium sp. NIES-65]|nr:unnamed protein product [Closterium sp. NIES-65]